MDNTLYVFHNVLINLDKIMSNFWEVVIFVDEPTLFSLRKP